MPKRCLTDFVLVLNTSWYHQENDMRWLQKAYGVPADMTCAVLTGHEDAPERIEAWRGQAAWESMAKRRRSPRQVGQPDFVKEF